MEIKHSTKEEYLKRIALVIDYINNHLDQTIDLKQLAEISNFSAFHFHRIFKAFRHQTLASYIMRTRIETAALLIRYSDLSIEKIAYNVGYLTPSSLSKSFKLFYGVSPIQYRNNKNNIIIMQKTETSIDLKLKAPKIIELEDKRAISIRLTGAYDTLDFPLAFSKLWDFIKSEKLFSSGIEHICIYHDDPKSTESENLRTDVCLVINKDVQANSQIQTKHISGGKYAVFLYQGPYNCLGAVYDNIYSQWLPTSGCELRDIPIFEKYCNDPTRTEPEKLKTEIYIPIK